MAQDILKNCKKYNIQKIISPNSYWIIECEEEKYNKKEMKHGDSKKNFKKCSDADQISIGQTVAVKYNEVFHTGKINNIFQRFKKSIYSVLLIGSGKSIETKKENIYFIESLELKNVKKKEFKISVHGIQPAEFSINHTEPYSNGILHLRKSSNWTPAALQFVKNLFKNIPYIFVKIISCDYVNVSGEIYFIRNSDGLIESLGQTLCDEGFAVFCDLMQCSTSKCGCWSVVEKKIPEKALLSNNNLNENTEEFNTINKKCNLSIKADQGASSQFMSYALLAYRSSQKQTHSSSVQNRDFQNLDSNSSYDSSDLSRFSVGTLGTLYSLTSCSFFNKEDPYGSE